MYNVVPNSTKFSYNRTSQIPFKLAKSQIEQPELKTQLCLNNSPFSIILVFIHSTRHILWGSSSNCWVYSCSNIHGQILPRSFRTTQPTTPSSNDLTQAKAHSDPINSTALSQPKMVSTIPRQSTGQWKIEPIHQDIKSLQQGISSEMSTGRPMLHRKLFHLAYRGIVTQSFRHWAS